MPNNIYQILREEDMTEILEDNAGSLVVTMYSSKQCKPCVVFKPTFVETAKKYTDCIFVYIDIKRYESPTPSKFLSTIDKTPTFAFYYNNRELVAVEGVSKFEGTLNFVLEKVNSVKEEKRRQREQEQQQQRDLVQQRLLSQSQAVAQQVQPQAVAQQPQVVAQQPQAVAQQPQVVAQQVQPQAVAQQVQQESSEPPMTPQEELALKYKILTILMNFVNNGAVLTNAYDMNSSLDAIKWEYQHQYDIFRQKQIQEELQSQYPNIQVPQKIQPESSTTGANVTTETPSTGVANPVVEQTPQTEDELRIKKMHEIQNLQKMNEYMQYSQMQKVHQLNSMLQLKKQQEDEEDYSDSSD